MSQLGVNVDHVATLRQARGGVVPSPKTAALEAIQGGAQGITVHLREDRRHIQERDVLEIKRSISVPLNLEMALAPDIIRFALKVRPEKVCIVPEKRRELTTEGGLDAFRSEKKLKAVIEKLKRKKIEVSLFIDPIKKQILAAQRSGADTIEIHTGTYANLKGAAKKKELNRIREAAVFAEEKGLIVNAGHGLDYTNVRAVSKIPQMNELNIGHSIVSCAVLIGMKKAVRKMKAAMR